MEESCWGWYGGEGRAAGIGGGADCLWFAGGARRKKGVRLVLREILALVLSMRLRLGGGSLVGMGVGVGVVDTWHEVGGFTESLGGE